MVAANQEPSDVLDLLDRATGRLLGTTITLSDEQWRAPSLLSSWSRGHVATHVARQADALRRLVDGALDGVPATMYDSNEARDAEIAAGADRTGEELHTDLDTSAAALTESFDRIGAAGLWEASVTLRGGTPAPVHLLPSGRLTEVVLHHVDLDTGSDLESWDAPTLDAVLAWVAVRLGLRVEEPFEVVTNDARHRFGPSNRAAPEVVGEVATVLAWVTGRSTTVPQGASGISLPPL